MPKLYAGLGLILLLGLAFWYHGNSNYQSGVNAERVRWQDREKEKDDEIIRLQNEILSQKQQAEAKILAERKAWENRIDKLKNMVTDCMPPDVLTELRDAGIYTGPIPCK